MPRSRHIEMNAVELTERKKRSYTKLSGFTARVKLDARTTHCILFSADIASEVDGMTRLLVQKTDDVIYFIFHRQSAKKGVAGIEIVRKNKGVETRRSEDFIMKTMLPMIAVTPGAYYVDLQLKRSKMNAPFKSVVFESRADNYPTLFPGV